ncbi:hypothetical protein Pst134EA_009571 [Puccinia striiformis f. sp. tritici]|uniref:hypothetical protein n=2 Tax=Puccinia striiformis f. sp. tritici TaxID=168172 RepID=UPI00200795FF|nr:hypothetical protein Pst134EA_009571 [Puccinia striiformis f. sp. tritici]KAH9469049.1 hypothetical protein Pst134EA_009571 [Puccinia striiformis f. sp. tritici]
MLKQAFTSWELPGNINKDIIALLLNYFLTPSSTSSTENIPALIQNFLKSRIASPYRAVVGIDQSILINLALILCFSSFILQLVWLIMGLRCLRISNLHWVVQNSEAGVLVPNTRFMMAILSVIFTLLSLSESILLILDMNLISTLKFRIIIAGLKWIPLWTSTWVYAWGMCSSIHITYSKIPNGTLGRLVGCKLSAVAFNMTVVGSLTLALMYEATTLIFAGCGLLNRIDSFLRIFARFEMMATHYDPANFTVQSTLLPELPGLLEMTLSVEDWRRDFCFLLYSRLAWISCFICLCLPLYFIYFRMIRNMRSHHNNINVELSYSQNQPSRGEPAPVAEDGCHVRCPKSDSRTTLRNVMCCDDTHLTLAAILSLVHALVEITLMIRFICLLEQSGNVSAQVTLLTETAITNNFIFAFTGLLSSWIFLTRSRSNFSKELPELK